MMVLLNLYSRIYNLLRFRSRFILYTLFCISFVNAEIIPIFNPISNLKSTIQLNIQAFVANDPVSLDDFFHDWDGKCSPKDGNNFALELARIDIGYHTNDYYVGYFYQRDVIIRTNRGFVDGYYAVKNDIQPLNDTDYDLQMHIDGVIRHGIVVSKDYSIYSDTNNQLRVGLGAYVSYDTDTQSGYLKGKGVLHTDSSYDASAVADYYYMDNLLYDLDVDSTYGLGYGLHMAISYINSQYDFAINLIANDLLSRSHWKNLPYSLVYVDTKNQTIGEDGYVEYDPTIHGWELYKDFIQKIDPKYHIDISKSFDDDIDFLLGWEYTNHLSIPYMKVSKKFDDYVLALQYDYRFNTVGIEYSSKIINLSIYSDGIANASSIGARLTLNYDF
jgi:hypothetical protein